MTIRGPNFSNESSRGTISVLAIIVVGLPLLAFCETRFASAQEIEHKPDASRALVWAPEVPWTEAELNPDVARRPRFVTALSRARVSYGVFLGVRDPDLPGDRIPKDEQAQFNGFLERVLSDEFLPTSWDPAQRSAYSAYIPGDARIEVVSWKTPFGDVRVSRSRKTDAVKVRLRVADAHRLVVRSRRGPLPDVISIVKERDQKSVFFETEALHRLLTGVFRVPFDTEGDYHIQGRIREFEGVRVFVGRVSANHWSTTDPHWYDNLRLLVTDSDPQYVGVSIDFTAEAKRDRSAP